MAIVKNMLYSTFIYKKGNYRKNKRLSTDSLFNLNQLNLINHKLTRTVSLRLLLNIIFQLF
ncbi:MAG: hypothetical protein CSA36_04290 [Draconibacterium sp.]|nr:MAG: hypothetical protein CSA36_04290 [Draconibacterium sp.]